MFFVKNISEIEISQYGLFSSQGALVTEVKENSVIYDSGIKAQDIIRRFNGKEVNDKGDLQKFISEQKIGSKVEIDYVRNGRIKSTIIPMREKEQQISVLTRIKRKKLERLEKSALLGMEVETITPEAIGRYDLIYTNNGVVVTNVEEKSKAALEGFVEGDIILKVGQKDIASPSELVNEYEKALKEGRNFMLLFTIRGEKSFFTSIDIR